MRRARAAAWAAAFAGAGLLSVYPVAWLARRALWTPGEGAALTAFRQAFAEPRLREGLLNTLALAALSAAGALALGAGLAALAARTDAAGRSWLKPVGLAPILVPPIVAALAWIVLADGQGGYLNLLLAAAGLPRADVFSFGGVAFVSALLGAPVVFLIASEAFERADGDLEDQARLCGASEPMLWRRVVLPLAAPSLAAAAFLAALQSVSQFGVHAPIGMPADVWTLTTLIYAAAMVGPVDLGLASALALLLVAVGLVLLALQRAALRRRPGAAGGRPPRRLALGRWRVAAGALAGAYVLAAFVLPYAALLLRSLRAYNLHAGSTWESARRGWNLEAYAGLAADPVVRRAFLHSLGLALATALVTAALGALAARLLSRGERPWTSLLAAALTAAPALTGVVAGLAVSLAFGGAPFHLYGTAWVLLLAYLSRESATGLKAAEGAFARVPRELEDAARLCGAGGATVARRVWWPLTRAAVGAGAALVFVSAFREVGASSLLYSQGMETVGSLMVVVWHDGRYQQLAALALAGAAAALAGALLLRRAVGGADGRAAR